MKEKIFISSEQYEGFQWHFQGIVAYDNIKSHKKTEFHLLSRKHIFEKTTGGDKLTSSFFRVKQHVVSNFQDLIKAD